jgi:chemotaxis methyl-accepting protein methylase
MKHNTKLILKNANTDISKYDDDFLLRLFKKRMNEIDCRTMDEYNLLLEKDSMERNRFLSYLQISYSEFFRNPLTFEVILHHVLPVIAQQKRQAKQKEIRIWSAACASGQESYSLAILLEEFRNNSREKINFRIFASDRNKEQIEEAKKGIYTEVGLGNIPIKLLKKWFSKNGDFYEVNPKLKENIVFSVFDLFNEECMCPSRVSLAISIWLCAPMYCIILNRRTDKRY